MELSTAQQILVIILSSMLAILLLLSIVIAVAVLKLIARVKNVVAAAEQAMATAGAIGDVVKKAAGQVGVLRLARGVFNMFSKHSNK